MKKVKRNHPTTFPINSCGQFSVVPFSLVWNDIASTRPSSYYTNIVQSFSINIHYRTEHLQNILLSKKNRNSMADVQRAAILNELYSHLQKKIENIDII